MIQPDQITIEHVNADPHSGRLIPLIITAELNEESGYLKILQVWTNEDRPKPYPIRDVDYDDLERTYRTNYRA